MQQAKKKTKKKQQKLRVVLKSFDQRLLVSSAQRIVENAEQTGANVSGPIPMPVKIKRFCVIRGPHVDKRSREHFEIRTHKRIIDILDPTSVTIETLTRLDLPAGVDVAMKM